MNRPIGQKIFLGLVIMIGGIVPFLTILRPNNFLEMLPVLVWPSTIILIGFGIIACLRYIAQSKGSKGQPSLLNKFMHSPIFKVLIILLVIIIVFYGWPQLLSNLGPVVLILPYWGIVFCSLTLVFGGVFIVTNAKLKRDVQRSHAQAEPSKISNK